MWNANEDNIIPRKCTFLLHLYGVLWIVDTFYRGQNCLSGIARDVGVCEVEILRQVKISILSTKIREESDTPITR